MFGYFARIASFSVPLWVLLPGGTALGQTVNARRGDTQADKESALLHRRIVLDGIERYDEARQTWEAFSPRPAKVYVVNLWTTYCEPCKKEFPFFQRLVRGWQNRTEVQFLFVADPPQETSEDDVAQYWKKNAAFLPQTAPLRSTLPSLRRAIENDSNPITLILDENWVVREAFVGAIETRPIGRSIERLLQVVAGSGGAKKMKQLSLGTRRHR